MSAHTFFQVNQWWDEMWYRAEPFWWVFHVLSHTKILDNALLYCTIQFSKDTQHTMWHYCCYTEIYQEWALAQLIGFLPDGVTLLCSNSSSNTYLSGNFTLFVKLKCYFTNCHKKNIGEIYHGYKLIIIPFSHGSKKVWPIVSLGPIAMIGWALYLLAQSSPLLAKK